MRAILALAVSLVSVLAAAKPVVIGHRGACGYVPEHTLAGYALGHNMGADYVEPDVVLTRDAVPIVLHDIKLDATSNVAVVFPKRGRADGFYAIDFTLAEIKMLRVGERREPEGSPVFPERFPSTTQMFEIPTLAEVVALVDGMNKSTGRRVGLYVEIKEAAFHQKEGLDAVQPVFDVLKAVDGKIPLIMQSFEPEVLKRLRSMWPGVFATLLLDEGIKLSDAEMKEASKYANAFGPSLKDVYSVGNGKLVSTSFCARAKQLGMKVHPYTLRRDAPSYPGVTFEQVAGFLFMDCGCDGVFTDFPDLLVNFLNQLHRRSNA